MSVNDPIEEMFRDNQRGLDEKPRDLLWDRIEERLDEKSVAKKKNNFWKYGAAASVVVGLTIGVWTILNNQNSSSQKENSSQIVLQKPMEVNEENASEILDKLEENKQSVVVRDEKKSSPGTMENEMEHAPELMKSKTVYDTVPMSAPAPAMEKAKKTNEEIIVYRGATPEKKDGNYILRNKSKVADNELAEGRRLGNMDYPLKEKTTIVSDSLIFADQIFARTSNRIVEYKLNSSDKISAIYTNSEISYPSKIIVTRKGENFDVKFEGSSKKKDSEESKEIQKYINENKNSIFYPIEID